MMRDKTIAMPATSSPFGIRSTYCFNSGAFFVPNPLAHAA
jgi:hypothetical protein